ncbi:MAG: protein phosphatase 1 regulatory subunit 42 [Betaproteobacteria bacterium]|nr:protein phosphatase 1 regulatory subunit 42 [Betaproteobacteria bacterium]
MSHTKRILGGRLFALVMTLALLALSPLSARAAPGDYNTGDVAVINAIIANNGLNWTPAPSDGSSIPADWTGVTWSGITPDNRILTLTIDGENLTGTLDVSGLSSLESLDCSGNNLSALDVSGLTNLTELYCNDNSLTGLTLDAVAPYVRINVSYNNMVAPSAITGQVILWDGVNFIFSPQKSSSVSAIPTLTETALVLLALLLGGMAAAGVKRYRRG